MTAAVAGELKDIGSSPDIIAASDVDDGWDEALRVWACPCPNDEGVLIAGDLWDIPFGGGAVFEACGEEVILLGVTTGADFGVDP